VTRAVAGTTRVAGIIGDPVVHSRSPAMHNAAYAACGLDWVYAAFTVPPGGAADALRGAGALGLAGLNVTMPHKTDAAAACDELTPTARRLSAANTITVGEGGRLLGDSTDGPGFLAALSELGVDPNGRRVLVLGAGGAGRAIANALGEVGAHVVVAARRKEAAFTAATLADGEAITLDEIDGAIADVDVIVNATPLGMRGEGPPFDADRLGAMHVVFDTVYHPTETPLMVAARAKGATVTNGLSMLVHQAAVAFRVLTGVEAPLDAMRAAAERVP
jgi:shikimate dehydrogenase